MSATVTGNAPHTAAHGVYTEPMNSTVVASAPSKGQTLGLGNSGRLSGRASSALVTSTSLASAAKPRNVRRLPGLRPQRFARVHHGKRVEVVRRRRAGHAPFQRARPPGVGGCARPAQALSATFTRNTATLAAMTKAPSGGRGIHAVPSQALR
jgi:hypothetical protein